MVLFGGVKGSDHDLKSFGKYSHTCFAISSGMPCRVSAFPPALAAKVGIVLGGGLSNLARLYGNVPKLWAPYIFTDRVGTRFLKNRHGDSSGVRGAAWL